MQTIRCSWSVTAPFSISRGAKSSSLRKFVDEAQRFYLKTLYLQANDKQRDAFKAKGQRLCSAKQMTQSDKTMVNAALITWLIDAVKPADAQTLGANNVIVQGGSAPSPRVRELLKQEGLNNELRHP